MVDLDAIKTRLIEAGFILEHQGQGDMTRGHVSVRLESDPTTFLMKPHSVGFDELTLENIITLGSLSPGNYKLEVSVTDNLTKKTITPTTNFTVRAASTPQPQGR